MSIYEMEYRMTVHLFGGTWSPSCCCYALRKTALDNVSRYENDVINMVLRKFDVHDCLCSVEDEVSATKMVHDLSELLSVGGFNLRKWTSNSKNVLSKLPACMKPQNVCEIDLLGEEIPGERGCSGCFGVHQMIALALISLKGTDPNKKRYTEHCEQCL